MACSLIRSVREYPELTEKERLKEGLGYAPKVPGRIVTTLPKAKELRPYVERLITMARKAARIDGQSRQYETSADRNTDEWAAWRNSDQWQQWNQATAPALALRRRVFAILRDDLAVDVLFTELAERFADRPGGYTRVIRLSEVRLGDAGQKALIEFVGERDREKHAKRRVPTVVEDEEQSDEPAATAADEAEAEPDADQEATE